MDITYRQKNNSGITLVEMMVTVGIFSVVSTVLFFRYSDFNNTVSVRNTAQDIALTIRKAQTYATSVQITSDVEGNKVYAEAYGISFGLTPGLVNEANTSQKRFLVFKDKGNGIDVPTPNKMYNGSFAFSCGFLQNGVLLGECLESFSIESADRVTSFCVPKSGGGEDCVSDGFLDITFRRPVPDAIICLRRAAPPIDEGVFPLSVNSCDRGEDFSYVKILVQSIKGITKTITVSNTGYISVK